MRYAFALALLLSFSSPSYARGHHGGGHSKGSSVSHSDGTHHSKSYAQGVPRDSHGRIKRSAKAREDFMKKTGYPHGRPGYVIDHIKPLKEGGADAPSNMQWQTKAAAKEKDRWE